MPNTTGNLCRRIVRSRHAVWRERVVIKTVIKTVNCRNFSDCGGRDGGCCGVPERAGLRVRPDGKGRPSYGTCEVCKVVEKIDPNAPVVQLTVSATPVVQPPQKIPPKPRSNWPPEMKKLVAHAIASDTGCGEIISRLIDNGGIDALTAGKVLAKQYGKLQTMAAAFRHFTGGDCGCADKHARLNRDFPLNRRYCYWTYCDSKFSKMAEALIRSLRRNGEQADFHCWSPDEIPSATETHKLQLSPAEKVHWLWKFRLLKDEVSKLEYQHYIYIDADSYCVRRPDDPLKLLCGDPVHAFLESAISDPKCSVGDWWSFPRDKMVAAMRELGVKCEKIYGVNGGAFIVKREAVAEFCDLGMKLWNYIRAQGTAVADEPGIAYAVMMMSKDPTAHEHEKWFSVWAHDHGSVFTNRLPDGTEWTFTNWLRRDQKFQVNPAILHLMRSKNALADSVS